LGSQSRQTRPGAVSLDWRRPLGRDKDDVYVGLVRKLEEAYGMFSVALDEGVGMRRVGREGQAIQILGMSAELCSWLSLPLRCLLKTMLVHARHFGVAPNLAPLNPEHFQCVRSQRVARFNELFSKVLLTRKSQFVHKISTLEDLVEELDRDYVSIAEGLAEEESSQPDQDWEQLDSAHYDLNTCLRETVVLYKSFLHALPDVQLTGFQLTLKQNCEAAHEAVTARARHVAHRRMAFLKGQ